MSVEQISVPIVSPDNSFDYTRAMEHLIEVVQRLSLARSLDQVMEIVRHAARLLTGADGATFVLRDGENCFYADEEAIAPLWKGLRFPMRTCISGWVMSNRQPVVIRDIYDDPRIPIDAYRPTFVRSLAMVPIRTLDPVGAIGNYWAREYLPTAEQVQILQALADTTAVAIENVQLYENLETRVRERTAELNAAQEMIQQLVITDELTGLYNRRGFMTLGTKMLQAAKRYGKRVWLLYADLNNLKQTNDELGHEAGDRLLRAAAHVLRAASRESDIVARLGGDEFAILGTGDIQPEEMTRRLQAVIGRHNAEHPDSVELSISAGVVSGEAGGDSFLKELLRNADQAMYAMKRATSNRAVVRG